MAGIPLTPKIKDYLKDNSIPYRLIEGNIYNLQSVFGILLNQNPNCCSEVDISNYGDYISDETLKVILEILDLYPASRRKIRITTRIQSHSKRIEGPKGFRKIATVVSGHGSWCGYVHFYHKIIGEQIK